MAQWGESTALAGVYNSQEAGLQAMNKHGSKQVDFLRQGTKPGVKAGC